MWWHHWRDPEEKFTFAVMAVVLVNRDCETVSRMNVRIIQVRPSRNPRWQKQGGWEQTKATVFVAFTAINARANQRSATHANERAMAPAKFRCSTMAGMLSGLSA